MTPIISVRDVSKTYGTGFRALDQLQEPIGSLVLEFRHGQTGA